MKQSQRIRLIKLSQAAPPTNDPSLTPFSVTPSTTTNTTTTTTTPTTTPTTSTTPPASTITIQSLPGYNSQLFSLRPVVITDLNNIVNFINQNISALSAGKYDYKIVYTNPSISGSDFSNSLKHLIDIGKWLYSTLIYRGPAYSLVQLQNIANNLQKMAANSSFPEPNFQNIQPTLIRLAIEMLNKVK